MAGGPILLVILALSIAFIVIFTAKFKVHAFLVLLFAALGVGLATNLGIEETLKAIKEGFGNTLEHIGIIIILGSTIGVVLEKTGAALSMANFILKLVGEKNSVLAISITGYLVSIPIFCDSGYIILSPLNKALAAQSKKSMAIMTIALSTALLTTHCLIPPHPGATAAAGIIGAQLGPLILLGLVIAIPGVIVGYLWAIFYACRFDVPAAPKMTYQELLASYGHLPHPALSFGPIVIPLFLIALKSFAALPTHPFGQSIVFSILSLVGDPTIALLVGLFMALLLVPKWTKEMWGHWIVMGIAASAEVLVIIAAGGAFGNLLRLTPIGGYLGSTLSNLGVGFFLPFIITAALKTAQGSSTVAIITASSLIAPLLGNLGLSQGWGPTIAVLSIGAGSMIVSHANDGYFWCITKFSDIDPSITFKAYTSVTFLIGVITIIVIYIVKLILL